MNDAAPAGTVILNKDNPDDFNNMPRWQQQQYKSFRAWLIYNTGHKDITSLTVALHDGLLLAKLIEKLSGKKLVGIEKRPRLKIHAINNLGQVFRFLKEVPIVINNIQPEDIYDANVKLTLGFLWVLILHYQIKNAPIQTEPVEDDSSSSSDDEDKPLASDEIDEELELKRLGRVGKLTPKSPAPKKVEPEKQQEKAKEPEPAPKPVVAPAKPAQPQQNDAKTVLMDKVNNYLELHTLPFKVTNFTEDWSDGMRFGALIHARNENLPPNWSEWKPENAKKNLEECFDIFKSEFGLPDILSPEDLMETKPDEKSLMTFVAMILHAFSVYRKEEKKAKKPKEEPKVETPPPLPPAPVEVKQPTPPPSPKKVATPPPSPREVPKEVPKESPKPKKKTHTKKDSLKKSSGKVKTTAPAPEPLPPPASEKVTLRVAQARRLKSANDKDDGSGYPDPYVKISYKDQKGQKSPRSPRSPRSASQKLKRKHTTKAIEKTLHPEWNTTFEFDKGELLRDEDVLEFAVRDKSKKSVIGVVRIPVKDIADETQVDKVYDEWLPLLDPKTSEKVDGDLRIVAAYGEKPLPEPTKYLPIKIRVAAGRELLGASSEGLSDPFCVLEVPGMRLKKSRTKVIKDSVNPEWDDEFFFDSGVVDAEEDVLRIKVMSDNGKDPIPLGVVEFPFKKVLETPFLDDWFPVMKHNSPDKPASGDIRLVVTYGRDLPPILTESFFIGVIAASNLAGPEKGGNSDPYVQFWVPGKKAKRLVLKTKTKRGTKNPVWNQIFEFELKYLDKQKDVIELHIFDRDLIGENEALGIVELCMKDIVTVPYIDSWFTIYNQKHRSKKGAGELQLRIAFGKEEKKRLEKSLEDEKSVPSKICPPATNFRVSKDVAEKKKVKKRDKRFHAAKGMPIRVRIVAASGLQGSPDPYVVLEIPGKKTTQKLKTKPAKKTGNPVWNEEFHMAGEPLEEEDRIRFCIKTGDMVGSSVLGIADVEVEDIIEAADGIYAKALSLRNAKNEEDKTRGQLHVLIAYGDSQLPEISVQGSGAIASRNRSGSLPSTNKNVSPKTSADDLEKKNAKPVQKKKTSFKKGSSSSDDSEEDSGTDTDSSEEDKKKNAQRKKSK